MPVRHQIGRRSFGVDQVNVNEDAICASGLASARRSQSEQAATEDAASAARNAVRKCGDSSDKGQVSRLRCRLWVGMGEERHEHTKRHLKVAAW